MKAFIVFAIALAIYSATILADTPFNEQTRQAIAFLHGRLDITTDSWIEASHVGPRSYALHPPLAPVVLIPFVAVERAIIGENALIYRRSFQPLCAELFGAIDVALVWLLLEQLGITLEAQIWLTAFFALGTVLWTETIQGTTWALPPIVAMAFQLLVLRELFAKARPWLVGVYAGLGFLALYQLIFVIPVYGILLLARRKSPLFMLPGLLVAAVLYIGYNELRYNTITDQGLWLEPTTGIFSQPIRPIFGLRYLPQNLQTVFVLAPRVDNIFPYVHPTWAGQAIIFTSPAFIMALRPSLKQLEVWSMWLAAALAAAPMLVCFVNGQAQFGTRHYLDCFPFLLVLLAIERVDQMTKILICASICLVGYGTLSLHTGWLGYS